MVNSKVDLKSSVYDIVNFLYFPIYGLYYCSL